MIFSKRNKRLLANIQKLEDLEQEIKRLNTNNRLLLEDISEREKSVEKIIQEKTLGFPWLADAIGEFYRYKDYEIANYLETKKYPAYKSADNVREIAEEKKILRKQLKIAKNYVAYYESLFPWITDYIDCDMEEALSFKQSVSEVNDMEADPVTKYVTSAQFLKLLPSERNQLALDRYSSSQKNPWEIGREYERYIGYLYEKKGYKVEYIGIEKGLEDMGRDLICKNENEILIIQCKYWSSYKIIHEKHINQLYGTMVKYFIDYNKVIKGSFSFLKFLEIVKSGKIKAVFVTSTNLSPTAKEFANTLGIELHENKTLEHYPLIKCNLSSNNEKIYHLPFDQQYDKTMIKNKNESYVFTVKEAEKLGFRRAYKWKGSTK